MAPKGRWGKKDAKAEPKAERVLEVRTIKHDLPDAVCVQLENFFTISECETYLEVLKNEIDWARQEITVNKLDGRTIEGIEPRLTYFMAEKGICYEYSGRDNAGVGWHPAILAMKQKAEQGIVDCGLPPVTFNCAQMNRYEHPRHALGMHSDNEPDLERGQPIASVSFGATREFRIMRRDDESQQVLIPLVDGCFMVMGGEMQRFYLHGVPAGGEPGLRINVTFRVCIPRAPLAKPRANAEGQPRPVATPAVSAAAVSAAPRGQGFRGRGYRSHAVPPQATASENATECRTVRPDQWASAAVSVENEPKTGWD